MLSDAKLKEKDDEIERLNKTIANLKTEIEALQKPVEHRREEKKFRWDIVFGIIAAISIVLNIWHPSGTTKNPDPSDSTASTRKTSQVTKTNIPMLNGYHEGISIDGGIYTGDLKDGKRNGSGKFEWDINEVYFTYEGSWIDDQRTGLGKQVEIDKTKGAQDEYEGAWLNNKYHGKGEWKHSDGDRYVGDWKDGKKDGKGIYYYNDGDKYDGEWKNDKRHGIGSYYNKALNTNTKWVWEDGKQVQRVK